MWIPEMKLGGRCSKSEFHSSLFLLVVLLDLKHGYLQPYAVECDWSVQRLSCPPYATTDWVCLKTQVNCTNGEEYHCLRDQSGEWTEICAKPIKCSKGQEPVLKNSQIVCSNCQNPERYEPVDGTESYKYSECRRLKTSCRRDVSYECPVDETVRQAQNRQCRCDHEKDYMPQNYDLNSDTWICKEPDDLNCIHAPCPEDVYGNAQTRGSDYRCFVDPNRPSTRGPSLRPSDRSSTVFITENHATRSSHNGDTEADHVTSSKIFIILVSVLLVVLLPIAIVLCKVMKCCQWCRKNKYAMPEGPLEVSKIQYRQMNLLWKPPNIHHTEKHKEPLVIHYIIEQVEGNTRNWVEVTTTKETSCQVTYLVPGTFYNFRVSAQYETGISNPLTTQQMYQTKCLTVPEKPQCLQFRDITTTYITLSWEPPAEDGGTPVTEYVVSYCNTIDNLWIKGQVLEDNITVWKQENLVKGQEYMFHVTARNKVGESDPLQSENTVMLLREPGKPEDINVTDIMCNEVTLSWIAPKDDGGFGILKYHVRLKEEGSSWQNILTMRSGVLSKTIKKLKPEHTYYFGICAENIVGEGDYCDTTKPTKLPKRLGPPDTPLGPLECLNIQYSELILSWKHPLYDGGFPVTHYEVQGKEGSWGGYTSWTIISAKTTMYHVKNLKDGTKYRFRVYAINEKGPSADPLVMEDITTKPINPPDMPAGTLEVSNIQDTEITLAWNPSKRDGGSPMTNFIIGKKEDSFLLAWDDVIVSPETTKYKLSGLKAGTAYKFRVRAANMKGKSLPVETSCTTTKVKGPPGIPEGPIEAVDITDDALTLIWNKPQDDGGFPIERYRIEIKETVGWRRVYCNNPEETRYRFSKLQAGTNYQFRVRAVNKKHAGEFIEKEVTTRTPKDRPSRPSADSEKNIDSSPQAILEKKAEDLLHELKGTKSWNDFTIKAQSITNVLGDSFHIPSQGVFGLQGKAEFTKGTVDIPYGFTAFESSDNGNSLYNSVSLILFGSENCASRLRLAAAQEGIKNRTFYIQQFFKGKDKKYNKLFVKNCLSETSLQEIGHRKWVDSDNLGDFVTQMAVRETAMPESKCNPFQVQFLSSASGFPIKQYFEKGTQNFYEDINVKPQLVLPTGKQDTQKQKEGSDCYIHILWVLDKDLGPKDTNVVNRIIPLIEIKNVEDTPV